MIRLLGELWVAAGMDLTHPWDASAYLVKGDEPTLIDCGSTLGYPALKRSLETFGYRPSDITRHRHARPLGPYLCNGSLARGERCKVLRPRGGSCASRDGRY